MVELEASPNTKEVSVPSRCAALLALPTAAAAVLLLAPSAISAGSSPASGSAYPWVQPWSFHGAVAPDAGRWTQPPASVVVPTPVTEIGAPALLTSYPWVQPWQVAAALAPDVGRWTQPPATVLSG